MSKRKPPDLIEAQSRGRFIQSGLFSFSELSRHEGIINILHKESGMVWSIISDRKNMTGFSLLAPGFFSACDPLRSLSRLKTAELNSLMLDGTSISYGRAPLWTGSPPVLRQDREKRKRELAIMTTKIEEGASFLSILKKKDRTIFQRKAREITEMISPDGNHVIQGLEEMIGLGQGLTPAGDDFITGALLAEQSLQRPLRIDTKKIEARLEKTTAPGRTLLFAALRGSFPAFILSYLEQIDKARSNGEIVSAARSAAKHGSTSGRDCLAGFYWYESLSASTPE